MRVELIENVFSDYITAFEMANIDIAISHIQHLRLSVYSNNQANVVFGDNEINSTSINYLPKK